MQQRDLTPQPGDVWERDGDRRELTSPIGGMVVYCGSEGECQEPIDEWKRWARGARLIDRGGVKIEQETDQ